MLPEMQERKKKLDNHTNILTHLLNEVKNRELDKFFELGCSLIFNGTLSN